MGREEVTKALLAKNPNIRQPGYGPMDLLNKAAGAIKEPLAYMTPGVGDVMAHLDAVEKYRKAKDQFSQGNYGTAAMYGLGGLGDDLTTVPAIGDVAMLGKGLGAMAMPLMTAYHGTPHRFPPTPKNPLGEFDLSKIGTGEGAQAYGHGIYLAESPKVAGSYKAHLTGDTAVELPGIDPAANRQISRDFRNSDFESIEEIPKDWWEYQAVGWEDSGRSDIANQIRAADKSKARIAEGAIYEVDLPDEHIEKMLDWDAPLPDKPEIKKLWNKIYDEPYDPKTVDGARFYEDLADVMQSKEGASIVLKKSGIPGIKYWDGGSREAAKGEGTRNFVLFDPEKAKIIGKK